MYGFTIGMWLGGIKKVDLYLHMMSQPPWDRQLESSPGKPFYIIHYTYGMDYKKTGAGSAAAAVLQQGRPYCPHTVHPILSLVWCRGPPQLMAGRTLLMVARSRRRVHAWQDGRVAL